MSRQISPSSANEASGAVLWPVTSRVEVDGGVGVSISWTGLSGAVHATGYPIMGGCSANAWRMNSSPSQACEGTVVPSKSGEPLTRMWMGADSPLLHPMSSITSRMTSKTPGSLNKWLAVLKVVVSRDPWMLQIHCTRT